MNTKINENSVCGWFSDLKKYNFVCIDECDHINIFKDLGEILNTNVCVAWMEFIAHEIGCIDRTWWCMGLCSWIKLITWN